MGLGQEGSGPEVYGNVKLDACRGRGGEELTRKSSNAPSSFTFPFWNSSSGRGSSLTSAGTSVLNTTLVSFNNRLVERRSPHKGKKKGKRKEKRTNGIPLATPPNRRFLLILLASGSSVVILISAIWTLVGSAFAPAPIEENTFRPFFLQCKSS